MSIETELERISQLEDSEQQGYESAPILVAINGGSPDQLLRYMLSIDNSDDEPDNVSRNIGVVRWCLDNR